MVNNKLTQIKKDLRGLFEESKGRVLWYMKRYEEALTAYSKATELNPKSEMAWRGKGTTLFSLKKYEDSLFAYRKAVKINPNEADCWWGLGLGLHYNRKYKEAVHAYNIALRIRPDNARIWAGRGFLYASQNKYFESPSTYSFGESSLSVFGSLGISVFLRNLNLAREPSLNCALTSMKAVVGIVVDFTYCPTKWRWKVFRVANW